MLEFSGCTPLYVQIKNKLLSDILKGVLQPGHKIPTEFELSASYGVSRITVRNAVLELVKSGHLIRRQGKGTYVNKPVTGESIFANQSFSSICAQSGISPGSKIVISSIRQADADDIKELEVAEGSKVLYIERLLCADGSPVILEYSCLPEKYSSIINQIEDNMSLYSLLESRFCIGKLNSVRKFGIAKTNAYQSGLLGVKNGTHVLCLSEITYDAKSIPVHRTRQLILGDRFEYIVRL